MSRFQCNTMVRLFLRSGRWSGEGGPLCILCSDVTCDGSDPHMVSTRTGPTDLCHRPLGYPIALAFLYATFYFNVGSLMSLCLWMIRSQH